MKRYWGRKPALRQITIKVIPDATSRAVAFETRKSVCSTAMKGCCRWIHLRTLAITPATLARLSAPAER